MDVLDCFGGLGGVHLGHELKTAQKDGDCTASVRGLPHLALQNPELTVLPEVLVERDCLRNAQPFHDHEADSVT
jgi:hypothetical protein